MGKEELIRVINGGPDSNSSHADCNSSNAAGKEKKSIHLESILYIMLAVSILAVIFAFITTQSTKKKYDSLIESMQNYVTARDNIDTLETTSDFLTEQVRQFVVTGNVMYLKTYFKEINIDKRREKSIENLKPLYEDGSRTYTYMLKALEDSNELAEKEKYAMKLVLLSKGWNPDVFDELKGVAITTEDRKMSDEKKVEKAYTIVFGSEYAKAKTAIRSKVSSASAYTKELAYDYQNKSALMLNRALALQRAEIFLLLLITVIACLIIYFLVLTRLKKYIKCIREQERLPEGGTYEFRYLVQTYNEMYDNNARAKSKLTYRAEHDALTKLLNREGFNKVKNALSEYPDPIGLIVVDVDKFKEVNDNFGHDAGDEALKMVASSLKKSFRNDDFVVRFGGDEFVVMMLDAVESEATLIKDKIAEINKKIKKSNEGKNGPDFSISAGIAFSEKGYSDKLFDEADKALYHVKENGRGNSASYSEVTNLGLCNMA